MKRCYFIGMEGIYDANIPETLITECEKVISTDDCVEFWFFHGYLEAYEQVCLSVVIALKSKYPEKDIKITRVFDPVKDNSQEDWFKEAYNTNFPRCIPDKNVFAPVMDKGVAQNERQFVQQANKVERWIMRQMDVVFAYYYPNLEDPIIAQIEFAQKYCEAVVVPIRFKETEKFILEKAETLFDDRTRIILSMYREGCTIKEICEATGLSRTRVPQIAHKAAREIRTQLVRRYGGKLVFVDRKCGLCNLTGTATALQLTVFKSLLEYLSRVYRVNEFWIDERSCNTPYSAWLAAFCAQSSYRPKAKVVCCLNDEDPDLWQKTIEKYVPPYSSVVNLGIGSSEWPSICEEMVRQCACIITDFSSPDAVIVKNLCAKSKKSYLFDLPPESYKIDEQYDKN